MHSAQDHLGACGGVDEKGDVGDGDERSPGPQDVKVTPCMRLCLLVASAGFRGWRRRPQLARRKRIHVPTLDGRSRVAGRLRPGRGPRNSRKGRAGACPTVEHHVSAPTHRVIWFVPPVLLPSGGVWKRLN